MQDKTSKKKCIFYPGPMHLFWTTGIYYLHELSKLFDIVLILERAKITDIDRTNYLTNFNIKKIYNIPYSKGIKRHRIYKSIANEIIKDFKPDFIFTNDDQGVFNTYLLRASKKNKSKNICYQTGIMEGPRILAWHLFVGSMASQIMELYPLPFIFAKIISKFYFYLMHFWHYYIAPILILEKPFLGKSSAFICRGRSAMRDGDMFIVFSDREKKICINDGLDANKIVTVPHPIEWTEKLFVKKLWSTKDNAKQSFNNKYHTILILLPHIEGEFAIRRDSGEYINKNDIYDSWKNLICAVIEKFKDSKIMLKAHPADTSKNGFIFNPLYDSNDGNCFSIVSNGKDGMYYAISSDIIIGETSTLLYSASRAFENKIVISVDFLKRVLGDVYSNDPIIYYVTDLNEFKNKKFERKTFNDSDIANKKALFYKFVEEFI